MVNKFSELHNKCHKFNSPSQSLIKLNPLTPEFLKWIPPSLNFDTSVVPNRGYSQNNLQNGKSSVDPYLQCKSTLFTKGSMFYIPFNIK